MPGRYFLHTPLAEIAEMFGCSPPLEDPGPRPDAAPGELVHAIVGGEGEPRRMVEMRWGMIPMGRVNARRRPVMETIINARSETLFQKTAFLGVQHAILPVNGWYEWTGKTRRKNRWSLSSTEHPVLAFAAIWDVWKSPSGNEIASLATVTVDPSPEVKKIHHRMAAILPNEAWPIWLGEEKGDPEDLLRTWPGAIDIRESALD
ncbi:MAG: SOS response-associated peptidase [Pseudomonadota bacterium]